MEVVHVDKALQELQNLISDFDDGLYNINYKVIESINEYKAERENEVKDLKEENKKLLTYNNQLLVDKHNLKKENEKLLFAIHEIKTILNK